MNEYVIEGEKEMHMIEMYPLIDVKTGNIISWRTGNSFRVNAPKKEKKQEEKKPLNTTFQEDEEI